MTEVERTSAVRVVALRSHKPAGVFAVDGSTPRLSWRLEADVPMVKQLGYEIQASSSPTFGGPLTDSGETRADAQVAVAAPGGPLRSREVRHYRVRVMTDLGASDWSEPLTLEAPLLSADDWHASAITLPDDLGRSRSAPSPLLRTEFALEQPPLRARLYVTSLGVHVVYLNGEPVGDGHLAPGWTTYRHRILADSFDVTAHLRPGRNAIGAILGDGWYRGRLGWMPGEDRCRYGSSIALLLQLEVELADGTKVKICSDETWRATTGEIRSADIYDGVTIDLREVRPGWMLAGHDDARWRRAISVPLDRRLIEPRATPPVRTIDVRAVEVQRDTGTRSILDAGQNLAGFARLKVRGTPGERVRVRHAEVLEADGALHTKGLRSALATDEYTLSSHDPVTLQPPFTFHGFRYAEVETSAEVLGAEIVAVSSDLPRRATFSCSDERLNKLHENVLWSLRGNFVSLPTDCPQRDERLGWTGDAQAFAPTACTLVESEAFWASWLRDLALDQDGELGVPSVVPDVVLDGVARFGRAGWADAATIVPWAVYESYGDPEILRRQFPSMLRWVESLERRRGADGLLVPSWQFGDWLDPDAPPDRPWEAKCDPDFIANAFFSWSARLLSEAADVIGEPAAHAAFGALAERIAALTWERWAVDAVKTQTGCAIALELRIAPDKDRDAVGAALADLVDSAQGRVATGFLGTPLVLPALASVGRYDSAYMMLLRAEAPSWLYQIAQGATTVWERWDAILPDGSIHPGTMTSPDGGEDGHMLSFNHYAYGAVIDWVYRHVAGIAPDRRHPGYAHVQFAPRPAHWIGHASASVDLAYGSVSIGWRLDADRLIAEMELPIGTTGTFTAPTTSTSEVTVDGSIVDPGKPIPLGPGQHRVVVARPQIAG
jgi:alpha-L-rhamnosidase